MTLADSSFTTSKAKADAFNKFFASVFLPRPDNPCLPTPTTEFDNSTEFTPVSIEEVLSLLSALSTGKATGPDGISARLLKECADVIAPSLTELFNKSLALGKVPTEWKYANIVPVPKTKETRIISIYHPISLLSLVSKVLEHAVHARTLYIVKPLLHSQQHGFRAGRSCITQLLDVVHNIGRLLHWYNDYLLGRKQRVVVDGVSSSYLDVTSGVPQGSIVGLLLFLVYVNDLPDAAEYSKVPMFADDSKCY
ncbi:Hypothetical predicted protein [Paramuricea clavata]|uniref:Uncharacterized protein n=1 Tax=Paramuricea clavata TaxID=317549 RepID=A0A6S7LNV3_PARCT|nr:Hypothetical predicted protein [Paramuricea clavata]